MSKPLIDTNTLIAVASAFGVNKDPWAKRAICGFADAFIYADKIRFTVPTPDSDTADPTQGLDILPFSGSDPAFCINLSHTRRMARPLRIQFENALYHVTSRGNTRQDIFLDDKDRERFLESLGHVVDRFGWICHAYCLT